MLLALLTLTLLLVLPVAGFVTYLWWNQERFILPGRIIGSYEKPDASITPYQPLTLETQEGLNLHGILFPATTSPSSLVLAFPGNMHDAVGFAAYLKKNIFPEPHYAVAAVSYRGYPNILGTPSEGNASQATMYADGLTLYDTLQQNLTPSETLIVAYSIGTTVAVNLATQRPVARMALFAPPASIRRIVKEKYPWLPVSLLLRNPFATEDILASLKTPTTIFYGPDDDVIPAAHITDVLHAANPGIALIPIPGAVHDISLMISKPGIPHMLKEAMKPAAAAQTSTKIR